MDERQRSGESMSWSMPARKISRGSISSAACTMTGRWTCPSRSSSRSATIATCSSTRASCRKITAPAFSRKFGIPTWISPVRMLAEMNLAPEAITDIVLTHAHFDHMGSIAEFPNAHIYIQKSELLSWYEAFALPKRFAHLTAIVDPDNIRTALDASIAHRVTLIDGDKNDVLPGIHVRLGSGHTIGQQFVISRRRPAAGSSRATASIRGASSPATTTTASTCRSTTPSAASGSSSRRSTR